MLFANKHIWNDYLNTLLLVLHSIRVSITFIYFLPPLFVTFEEVLHSYSLKSLFLHLPNNLIKMLRTLHLLLMYPKVLYIVILVWVSDHLKLHIAMSFPLYIYTHITTSSKQVFIFPIPQ